MVLEKKTKENASKWYVRYTTVLQYTKYFGEGEAVIGSMARCVETHGTFQDHNPQKNMHVLLHRHHKPYLLQISTEDFRYGGWASAISGN